MLLGLVGLFLLGAMLMIVGLRGFRVGDHPICRKCAFDLFGLPAEQERCPECGHALSGGTFVGHKKRRRWAIAASLLMFVVATSGASMFFIKTDLTPYLPVWWIEHEIRTTPANARVAKLVIELNRRLAAGKLSQGNIDSVADLALVEQADLTKTWNNGWGNFIEAARSQKKLDDDRWKKYAAQSLEPPTLVIRKKIRRGDPIPIGWRSNSGRTASQSRLIATRRDKYIIDVVKDLRDEIQRPEPLYICGSSTWLNMDEGKLRDAKDGVRDAELISDVEIHESDNPFPNPYPSGPALATRHFDMKKQFELLPANTPVIKHVHDDSLAPQIRNAVTFVSIRKWPQQEILSLSVHFGSLPVCVAFSAEFRSGNKVWKPEWGHGIAASRGGYGPIMTARVKGMDVEKVDVVLRSNEEEAVRTLDQDEMWDGEILLKDVPVIADNWGNSQRKK